MKKLMTAAVMLTAIICTNANAASVPTHEVTQAQREQVRILINAEEMGKISKFEYRKKLASCSNSGNAVCSMVLGEDLFNINRYAEAFPHLIKSSGTMEMNGKLEAVSDSYLGEMYARGLGVPLNTTTALRYYKSSALHGDAEAALGIFTLNLHLIKSGEPDSKYHLEQLYKWIIIAHNLGMDKYKGEDGETVSTSDQISMIKGIAEKELGKAFFAKADESAAQICSTIDGCIQ